MFDLLVVDELELGRVPQRQRTSELAAQESRGAIQALRHFLGRVLARRTARRRCARVDMSGATLTGGDRDVADARIAHFARHQRRQDALHLAFDAGEAL